jgi:hypothetical protein
MMPKIRDIAGLVPERRCAHRSVDELAGGV